MIEPLPLAGRTVVEIVSQLSSEVVHRAVALAGRIAADLGADVVRLVPAGGDPLAHAAPLMLDGAGASASAADAFLNGGKRRLAAGAIPASADAVLFDAAMPIPRAFAQVPVRVAVATGVPADLGGPETSVTDVAILALSGLLDLVGDPDAAPVPFGGHQAAGVAGLAAFSGMMAALAAQAAGATKSETVHVSAVEACLWSNWKSFAERLYLGRGPTRQGHHAEWQALECADGFAAFVYLEKDWPAVCRLIGDARLTTPPFNTQAGRRADMAGLIEIVKPWYRRHTRAEIYARARALGLPIAPVLSVGEVIEDGQFAAQSFFAAPAGGNPPAAGRVPTIPTRWNGRRFPPRARPHVEAAATHPAMPPPGLTPTAPLAGVRVLDLGIITAGASTSAVLADLGADVIKLESQAYIDPFRTWDRGLGAPDWWNRSRFFQFTNRNKRGLALDLKHPEGKRLFLDLVAKSDVLVENFRRGVLERLGLGADVLAKHNPRLIVCQVTSQGETGPDAGNATYGSTLEATSGLADLTRAADGRPLISGILVNYPDQIVSIYAAGIVALAVMEQRRTGRGARLDISQRELASFLIGEHILAATTGMRPSDERAGPDLRRNADGRWMLTLPGGAAVPVRHCDDLLAAFERGETPSAFAKAADGSVAKGVPFALGRAPLAVSRPAPDLGQHNAEILAEVLGLDAAAIAALARAGVIGTTPKG